MSGLATLPGWSLGADDLGRPIEPPQPREVHSCNLHVDCDEAQRTATAKGRGWIDHCHDEDCEDCFGK